LIFCAFLSETFLILFIFALCILKCM
jgi:hypothetical protein